MARGQAKTEEGSPRRSILLWIAVVALAVHAALVFHESIAQSATMDEVVYAPAGYARLTGAAPELNPEHPPLMKLLLGATWLGSGVVISPQEAAGRDAFRFGYQVLYGEPQRAATLLLRARLVPLALSILCGATVFLLGTRYFGSTAGAFAALFYALDPLALAHAGLATLDMGLCAAAFLAVAALLPALDQGRPRWILAAGAATGAALAIKVSGVALLPSFLAIALAPALAGSGEWRDEVPRRLGRLGLVLAIAGGVLVVLCLPDGPAAWSRAWAMQVEHSVRGHESFAAGRHSSHGWWWYYPFVWAVKTPLPTLIASLAGVVVIMRRLRAATAASTAMLAFPLTLLGAAIASPLALGARQLLPAVPFLSVAAGVALARAWRMRSGKLACALLVGWLAIGTALVHPYELAYANEAAGGPRNLHRLLADSNVDWGQAMPALAQEVARLPIRTLWLDYFGNALPRAHGLAAYRRVGGPGLGTDPRSDGGRPDGRELLAVSTTLLHDVYGSDRGAHAWLRRREPIALPGYSIALFDITGDAEAYRRLANTAERVGDVVSAAEAWTRALELGGPDSRVLAGISRIYLTIGARDEAASGCAQAAALSPGFDARECREVPRGDR